MGVLSLALTPTQASLAIKKAPITASGIIGWCEWIAVGNKLWDATFGGWFWDHLWAMQQTSDGGFILAGESESPASGNKTAPRSDGSSDAWLVRLDASGNKLWDKAFGGRHISGDYYQVRAVLETPDRGFLVAGSVREDFWILRLNESGQKLWDRAYGGPENDFLTHAIQTADLGYVLAGHSTSGVGGTKTSTNYGGNDLWIVRLDAAGNELWDRSFGGEANEESPRVIQTSDGGFLVGGNTTSALGGNKSTPFHGGEYFGDYWVLRLDAEGNKLWEQDLGGSAWDVLADVQQSLDGGFIITGYSASPADGNKTAPLLNRFDLWFVRLNATGAKVWDQSYNGLQMLFGPRGHFTPDGGMMVAATAIGDPTDPGTSDLMLFKFSADALTAPHLRAVGFSANDFRFQLSGISNRTYVTEFSTDLNDWTPLATNQLTANPVEVRDSSADRSTRFYRARMVE